MLVVAWYRYPGWQSHKEELKQKELVLRHCIFAIFGFGFQCLCMAELGFRFLYFAGDLREFRVCLCRWRRKEFLEVWKNQQTKIHWFVYFFILSDSLFPVAFVYSVNHIFKELSTKKTGGPQVLPPRFRLEVGKMGPRPVCLCWDRFFFESGLKVFRSFLPT